MSSGYHIAQINIARLIEEIDSPRMATFFARIDEINALAERTPGFVWRLKGDDGNAMAIRVFDDNMLVINMSVWESIDALYNYTYFSDHAEVYRRRAEWFPKLGAQHLAMWWVEAGHIPTPAEAKERLAHIEAHGPTPTAFTFKQRFDPPNS